MQIVKKKSLFPLIIIMVVVVFVGLAVTLVSALLVGSAGTSLIDFSNMNFASFGIIIGIGLISIGFIITIILLIIAKIGFDKGADWIKQQKEEVLKK